MIPLYDRLAQITYTEDEERELAKLEAIIDATPFDGAPIRVKFDQVIKPKIAAALQRRYEENGSWRVSIQSSPTERDRLIFTFFPVFFQPAKMIVRRGSELPPVASYAPVFASEPTKRLLVRIPTRSRPKQAIETLTKYRCMAGVPIQIEVVIDEDDETMLDPRVLQRLHALDCVVTVGRHKSKVEACNAGRVKDWDILVLASDDMVPVIPGWANIVISHMNAHWPHLDGALHFADGYADGRVCTLPIMGRRLYDQFGFVYHPTYESLFCDNEQTEVLQSRGRLVYIPEKIIEHHHHVTGKGENDALYRRNDALWERDKAVYEERKMRGFNMPSLRLSILICTVPSRERMLNRLLDCVWAQSFNDSSIAIEVRVDWREAVSIGAKRQSLLESARGDFVAFIDDDDMVSYDYVTRILNAIEETPDADCVSLNGIMTTAGEVPERFECSLKNSEWKTENGVHYRSPQHLNPVRRELALKAGFEAKSHGEDHGFSVRLYPLLKKEASTGEKPLYYYFFMPQK